MKDKSIVVRALTAEYIRLRSKMHGAEKRLHHAEKQVEIETEIIFEARNELVSLQLVIEEKGGQIPDDPDLQADEVAYQDP